MSNSRVILVASPVGTSSSNSRTHPSAQIVAQIQAELDALWLGWSDGNTIPADVKVSTEGRYGVRLEAHVRDVLAERVNSAMLWPTFYGRTDLIDFDSDAYELYQNTNARLAVEAANWMTDDAVVWAHDYMHLPFGQALRRAGSMAPVGFLFHAPFPPSDLFVSMPRHEQLLRQLCVYDVISFQSEACRGHFEQAAHRSIGAKPTAGGLVSASGRVRTRVDELPGRYHEIKATIQSPIQREAANHLRGCTDDNRLIGSFASLDPAQGILERFHSFEMLLDEANELKTKTSLVHASLPQHPWLTEDTHLRAEIERVSSSINGKFATLQWNPIHYFHDPLDDVRFLALCRESSVALVTPFCEGVSLAAKDFVAAQEPDDPGVLILSNLISSALRYDGALLVNPHDKAALMQAMRHALAMPRVERHIRWRKLIDLFEGEMLSGLCHRFIDELKSTAKRTSRNAG